MAKVLIIFLATVVCFGCTDDSSVTRSQVCRDYCEQLGECSPYVLESNFETVSNCVNVCKNYELEDGCTDGIPSGCTSAMFIRWACVASLECVELSSYFSGNNGSEWELKEDAEGNLYWENVGNTDYPCFKKDKKVHDECVDVSWSSYPSECGYDSGDSYTNYYDDEFDDF